MQTKHTPGPWKQEENEIVGQRYVCTLHMYHLDRSQYEDVNNEMREEYEANARLIAAAPELLGALEKNSLSLLALVKALDEQKGKSVNPDELILTISSIFDIAGTRAALAKAKGE